MHHEKNNQSPTHACACASGALSSLEQALLSPFPFPTEVSEQRSLLPVQIHLPPQSRSRPAPLPGPCGPCAEHQMGAIVGPIPTHCVNSFEGIHRDTRQHTKRELSTSSSSVLSSSPDKLSSSSSSTHCATRAASGSASASSSSSPTSEPGGSPFMSSSSEISPEPEADGVASDAVSSS